MSEISVLDLFGATLGMMAVMVNAVAVADAMVLTLRGRLIAASVAGAWVGLSLGLAAAGALTFSQRQPIPLVGVFFVLPLVAFAVCWVVVSRFREAVLALPPSLLIGLNSFRVVGVLFLFLEHFGRLSGPFPVSAGWGDIITGALALPIACALAHVPKWAIFCWNAFGALDLIVAVGLGLASANNSPLQMIHAGAGSEAMQHLPFSLVPTVLVPFYLMTHFVVASQYWSRKGQQIEP